ncbi:MAG: hypothetical protein AAGG38_08230 [Planctomycetota bacterium]
MPHPKAPAPPRRSPALAGGAALCVLLLSLAGCQTYSSDLTVAGLEVTQPSDYRVSHDDRSPKLGPGADIPAYRYPGIRRYGY